MLTFKFRILSTILAFFLSVPTLFAQSVGINSSGAAPDPSAMLDVAASDKGVLIPRVQLNDVTTQAPISATPVEGLLIYNATGSEPAGYYYWNGSQWLQVSTGGGGLNSGLVLNGNTLELTDPGGTLTADLSPLADSTDNDSVIGNEYNSSFTLSSDQLSITDPGNTYSVDLSGYADSTDNDSVVGNEYNTGMSLSNDTLKLTDNGGTLEQDLSSLGGGYWDRDASNGYLFPTNIGDQIGVGTSTPTTVLNTQMEQNFSSFASKSYVSGSVEAIVTASGSNSRVSIGAFSDHNTNIWAGGAQGIRVRSPSNGEYVEINPTSNGVVDLNIVGEGDPDLFWSDVNNDRIGIGVVAPTTKLEVDGTITGTTKNFKIDHPEKEGKVLYHASVESDQRINKYTGKVTTNENGKAEIELPEYVQLINKDFRYNLTVIGTFAQAIVAEEFKGNSFLIKTDKPNVKVSWELTGVRDDPYARRNPYKVVRDAKEANSEKGGEEGSTKGPEKEEAPSLNHR